MAGQCLYNPICKVGTTGHFTSTIPTMRTEAGSAQAAPLSRPSTVLAAHMEHPLCDRQWAGSWDFLDRHGRPLRS